MITLKVRINGTETNPWHKMGLTQNPFPQIAKAQWMSHMMQLGSLDGDPIKNADDIRIRLKGWTSAFVDLCVEKYKPGERVIFIVEFPD